MWHEGVAQRGANNIASCVWRNIEDQAQCGDCKEFVFLITVPGKIRIRQ